MNPSDSQLSEMIQASGIAPAKVREALASFEIAVAKEAAHSKSHTVTLEDDYDLPVIADSLQVGPVMTPQQLQSVVDQMKLRIVRHGGAMAGNLGSYSLDNNRQLTFRIDTGK